MAIVIALTAIQFRYVERKVTILDRRRAPPVRAASCPISCCWPAIAIVAFPVYLAFVASTHDAATIANGQMPLTPGQLRLRELLAHAVRRHERHHARAGRPDAVQQRSSWRSIIAIGKIAISILSAYAVVYFRFPLRMAAFWLIFVTLMLPVEVRIYPTYKIVADLGLWTPMRA